MGTLTIDRMAGAQAQVGAQMELPITALVKTRRKRPRLPRVRGDSLPEQIRYRDDGCDIFPHCLTCPLPKCRYDEPGGLRGLMNAHRDREMIDMRLKGTPVDVLAGRFNVSRRTVFRVLGKEARCA